MMKQKKGFTLMEVMLVMAIFSMASVVIFSVFMSNYMRIEAQGRETYLQEDIDRGLTRLSNRLMGTCEIISKVDTDDELNTESMTFKYYYKDNNTPYQGELYLVEKDGGGYTLKLHSARENEEFTNTLMTYLDEFKIEFFDENGLVVTDINKSKVCALEINYIVTTSFKKIVKKKDGNLTIKLRNIT